VLGSNLAVSISRTVDTCYPAVADSVASARQRVADYAARAGLRHERVEAVRLAVSEAVTNAVIHAYRGRKGKIRVAAKADPNQLWVSVTDEGCGYRSRSCTPGLGFGLPVMAEAADGFGVGEGPHGGTEVQLRFRIGGAAGSAAADHSVHV
jgi:anti-sigma regulatory factor (Ser/Thr protein kinase)